jgi:LysM repeat protein
MKDLGYSRVDLYTGSYFYNDRLKPESLNVTKPWLASYPSNPVKNQPTANFSNGKGAWQWSQSYRFIGMANYGYFDVSEDYAGKYTIKTAPMQKVTKTVGTIQNNSLVNYMISKHMDPSYGNRAKLVDAYGITNYQGTSAQNLALIYKLKSGVKPAKTNTSNSKLTTKQTALAQKQTIYVVKKGDALGAIANKYKTTVAKLKSLNKIKNINRISIGQKLRVK